MVTITRTFRLTGWRAVAVVVALAGAGFGVRAFRAASFDEAGRAAVESHLITEAQRSVIDSARSTIARVAEGDIGAGLAAGEALFRAQRLAVRTLGVHGFGDTLHVRVTYGVRDEEAEQVRYLRVAHSTTSGWRVVGRSSAFAYHTRF